MEEEACGEKMSDKALGICFYVLAMLLMMPAIAGIIIDSPQVHMPCNRYCWLYDLLAELWGASLSRKLQGFMWLVFAMASFIFGWKLRHRSRLPSGLKGK
jgi:hypothetical protein